MAHSAPPTVRLTTIHLIAACVAAAKLAATRLASAHEAVTRLAAAGWAGVRPAAARLAATRVFLPAAVFVVCLTAYLSNGDFLPGSDQQGQHAVQHQPAEAPFADPRSA